MKSEKILDALQQIDEELIEEAAPGNKPPKKAKKQVWMKWAAMAACAVVIVGVGVPYVLGNDANSSDEAEAESNINTTGKVQNVADVGENHLVTMDHMEEIKLKIDEMLPDGFVGTIEVGSDLFKVGEKITIIAQDNVTVVQNDGSIFDYDEIEPNIKDSDLTIGSSVWVGFQKYDYVVGNGQYNQIFAYHVSGEKSEAEMVADEGFPNWGLTLSVKDVTESGLTLVCTQAGGEITGELQTGSEYRLIVLKEAWEDVPAITEANWDMLAYMVAKDDVTEFEINWEWLYGKLQAGTYRLVKDFTEFRETGDYDDFSYWVEFEIK